MTQVMYGLVAPLITWPGYEDHFPKEKRIEAQMMRLARVTEIFRTKQATEMDAMLYLSSASLINPMGHKWARIYGHLFARYMNDPEKMRKAGLPTYEELDPDEDEMLARFRQWIFRRQLERVKHRVDVSEDGPGPAEWKMDKMEFDLEE